MELNRPFLVIQIPFSFLRSVFFLQKSFHSFGDGSSREAGQYVRVTDEGVTADARGRPWGPWGGTCPTPGQNNGDFIPWHALSAYSRDTAPRFWR